MIHQTKSRSASAMVCLRAPGFRHYGHLMRLKPGNGANEIREFLQYQYETKIEERKTYGVWCGLMPGVYRAKKYDGFLVEFHVSEARQISLIESKIELLTLINAERDIYCDLM